MWQLLPKLLNIALQYKYAHTVQCLDPTVVSWVSAYGRSTVTPCFSLPWALTMCQIMHKISGWSQHTINGHLISIAATKRACIAFSQGSCSAAIQLLVAYRVDASMAGRPLHKGLARQTRVDARSSYYCWPHLCVATFGGTCLDASTFWRAGVQKLPGRLPYVTVRI